MQENREIFSVSALNQSVAELLSDSYPLIWVEGEISNLVRPSSGHLYFSLKDEDAQVRCAMFRGKNQLLNFKPANGDQVLLRARVSLYEPRGEYQLVAEHMEQAGDGRLRQAFELLKNKLLQEGLFNQEHKQDLPTLPRRIGVITSATGAAVHDILTVLRRRFPAIPVLIYPVAVQGKGAAEQISAAINLANQRKDCDVLLLSRGGGSLEDLWPFNEEIVARAIYASALPLVSAVGHEIDFTISDFTADVRAATPSAAAELLSPDQGAIRGQLTELQRRLVSLMQRRLEHYQQRIDYVARHLQSPAQRLQQYNDKLTQLHRRINTSLTMIMQQRLGQLKQLHGRLVQHTPLHRIRQLTERNTMLLARMQRGLQTHLTLSNRRLASLAHNLEAVSPLATLARGYAIVRSKDKLLRSVSKLKKGDTISAQLLDGIFTASVSDINSK